MPRADPAGRTLCGDYAVNTIQPTYQPYAPGTADTRRLPPQTAPTIGDRLSAKGVDWAWYSGGWSNADGDVGAPGWTNGTAPGHVHATPTRAGRAPTYPNCPDKLFQFHHQPFNYFASFAPGTRGRAAHLRDEEEFEALAQGSTKHCALKPVSFVKPIGDENEHPGYASVSQRQHATWSTCSSSIQSSRCAKDTMVVVTYDEFGGQWDHVSPPGQGGDARRRTTTWGPSTRIPALVLAPGLRDDFVVDHTRTTRRRSWPRSSTASACRRWPRATPRSTTCRACSPLAGRAITTATAARPQGKARPPYVA